MQSDLMFDRIEKLRNFPLTNEEKAEIDLWARGRALAQIFPTEGYQEILAMLESYAGDQMERLMNTDPAETKDVLAYHAVAFAASKIYNNFKQDVARAVEASRITPLSVKEGFKAAPAPAESM